MKLDWTIDLAVHFADRAVVARAMSQGPGGLHLLAVAKWKEKGR
jgi:hypothetical protein